MAQNGDQFQGGCVCGEVRYQMTARPMIVHCCHCSWCQRETGSAFVLNAMIEASHVQLLKGEPKRHDTPSNSGKGQKIWRCPSCCLALWSNYAGAGEAVHFIRVGTLDQAGLFPPDIHIFTSTKLPWVVLPDGVPAYPEYYDRNRHWSTEALARRERVLNR